MHGMLAQKGSRPLAGQRHTAHRSRTCRKIIAANADVDGGAGGSGRSKEGPSTSGRTGATPGDADVGLKAVWYGAEQFGKLINLARPGQHQQQGAAQVSQQPMSREEMLAAMRADYDAQYFVRGVGDMAAYAPDCTFSDPFVSFKGTQRFKQNVSNLGGLMSDIQLDVYGWEEGEDTLLTRWRFSCLLDLPWRPRLAASGSTLHVLDLAAGRVVAHEERWEVEPGRVVAQLLRPAAKVPSNAWETFLLAASAGDAVGMWFVLSPLALRGAGLALAASLAAQLLTGEGLLTGPAALGCGALAAASVATEVVKFAGGMQGGETGTGGRF